MYQTVDDVVETETDAPQTRRLRSQLWMWLALAVVALGLIALFSQNRGGDTGEVEIALRAERASYHTAISERDTDLRRARLRDFEITYSQSELLPAVRAQLAVLDAHETKDWATLTDVMFAPEADKITKLAAIQNYESKWGASYLGGRDKDLRDLREGLEIAPEPMPNRELKDVKSPIPTNVPDQVMVGGPRSITPPPPPRPVTRPAPTRSAPAQTIEARVRKNVTPRYPRRAQRRSINAVVTLSLAIDDEGEVQMTEVVSVTAERYAKDFIKAAERAAMRTRYHPKTVGGRAVPTQGVQKRYIFKMD